MMLLNPYRFVAGGGGGELPTTIGQSFGGGYYIGDITITGGADAGTYAVIMADASATANMQWKTATTATTGTDSNTNGRANTLAMQTAGLSAHPAAQHCLACTVGGHTDWYLPAKDELALLMVSRAILATPLGLTARHWASTQQSTANGWAHDTYSGGIAYQYSKTLSYAARPTRRLRRT